MGCCRQRPKVHVTHGDWDWAQALAAMGLELGVKEGREERRCFDGVEDEDEDEDDGVN